MSTEQGLCDGIRALPCPEKPVQGLDNGLTAFDGVRLPLHSMLPGRSARITDDGRFEPLVGNARSRFLRAMSRIVPGRLCVSSSAVGMGRASVYIALRHAAQRLTNAPGTNAMPVIEYRSHQLATFGALAKAYAITLMVNQVKRDYLAQLLCGGSDGQERSIVRPDGSVRYVMLHAELATDPATRSFAMI